MAVVFYNTTIANTFEILTARLTNMADTVAAPATYKQPSRKGKKAWRKNVDVTEVQAGLEDVRDQIIQG